MPYRDNKMAVEARRVELQRELADLSARVNDFAYLKWKQKELETELANLDTRPAPRNYRKIVGISATLMLALVVGSAVAFMKLAPLVSRTGTQCGVNFCCGLGCPSDGSMRKDDGPTDAPQAAAASPGAPINRTPHMADRSGPPLPVNQPSHVAVDYVLGR